MAKMTARDEHNRQRFTRKLHALGSGPRYTITEPSEHAPDLGPCWEWKVVRPANPHGRVQWFTTPRERDADGNLKYVEDRLPYEVAWEIMHARVPHKTKRLVQVCRVDACMNPQHVQEVDAIEPVKPKTEGAAVTLTPILTQPVVPVVDTSELRAIINGEPVSAPDNVTPLALRAGPGEMRIVAGLLTREHIGARLKTVVDGQPDRECEIVEIAQLFDSVRVVIAVGRDAVVKSYRPGETVAVVPRMHDVIPGLVEQ